MLNRLSRIRDRNTLRSLNPRNLHRQKELRRLDAQSSTNRSNSRFSGEIDVQLILEESEVRGSERSFGGEFGEGEC